MSALTILQIAQALLTGEAVTKAEPAPGTAPDPDNIQGHDGRTEGGAPTPEQLEAARAESQAGQQAAAAQAGGPGDGGDGGAPGGAPGEGGEGGEGGAGGSGSEPDGDEVTKAEILASITFLATHHKIPAEEVAKALGFSGGEGDPTAGKAPVGQGIELLQKIAEQNEGMNKILDAIAGFLSEMSKKTVSLATEVGKSLEAAEAAKASATETAEKLAGIVKAAPAMSPKAQVEVVKALPGEGGGAPTITANDLFRLALEGKHTPHQIAHANRAITYGLPVSLGQ